MRVNVLRTGALLRATSALAIAVVSAVAAAGSADAGGFALREQSSEYQGMAFAGNAAGTSISSMFWNSAAAANQDGFNMESSYTLIAPHSEVTTTSVDTSSFGLASGTVNSSFTAASNESGNIAQGALLGASYGTYQISKDLFIGMAVNTPFGLTIKPEDENYDAAIIARTSTLKTFNANPTIAYRVNPALSIGVGVQIQYGDGRFRFANVTPVRNTALAAFPALQVASAVSGTTSTVEGTGWGFGGTAGITITPATGTRLAVGYRSRVDQEINGSMTTPLSYTRSEATLHLPDIVTVSLQQTLTPTLRLAATFEWSNWSRFEDLTVKNKATGATLASLPFNWNDGYFFSAGLEYDASDALTVRAGTAYEISPIDSPEKRSTGIPDADRVWLSAGLTYDISSTMSVDFAYSHIFVEDSNFTRTSLSNVTVSGDIESRIDLISLGLKTKW